MRRGVVKSRDLYAAFAADHPHCQICGVHQLLAPWPGLSRHHIIKPGRSDEHCNLLMLCHFDHLLCEGQTIRIDGVTMPKITLGMVLLIKATDEPELWNPIRLLELSGRACLPDLEFLPDELTEVYRTGRHLKAW